MKKTLREYVCDEVEWQLYEIKNFCLTKNFTRGDANHEKVLSDR